MGYSGEDSNDQVRLNPALKCVPVPWIYWRRGDGSDAHRVDLSGNRIAVGHPTWKMPPLSECAGAAFLFSVASKNCKALNTSLPSDGLHMK